MRSYRTNFISEPIRKSIVTIDIELQTVIDKLDIFINLLYLYNLNY